MTRSPSAAEFRPPVAEKRPTRRIVHGIEIHDDYAWLKAENWSAVLRDPSALPADIRAVIEAENAYAKAVLGPTELLQATLVAEMRGRIKEDDADLPAPDGPFSYYTRHRPGGQHELVCRTARDGGDETLLLDGDDLAKGKEFFHLRAHQHAPDHKMLAWSVDERGSEFYTIRVRDLATGLDSVDVVTDSDGAPVWTADSTAFFYVRLDDNHRPSRVFLHTVGTDPAADHLIYEETDPGWFVHLHHSLSTTHAVIQISDHDSAEAHLIDLAAPLAPPRVVTPRREGVRYEVETSDTGLFVLTNDEAEDFRILQAPFTGLSGEAREIVPHRPGCLIVGIVALRRHLVRLERENSLPRLVIRDIATGDEHSIAFDEEAYTLSFGGVLEYDTDILRFSYASMTTPRETFDYDMGTRERVLRKRQDIPSGHDPQDYATRRVTAMAADGALVPISLLWRKTTVLDGSAPVLLYAYGAYGHATPASFSANRLSLVDRGFVYAIAHVRGGTDKGFGWYTDGKLAKKPNTFSDFVACARHLVESQVTSAGRIVAMGGSAGGMLMGAITNMAPELFAGVIADVPFVDVLATMLDAELPLTPPEWLEWGNPITDPAAFATILSYSPYDNVAAKTFPALLALGGLTDPRVTYWEPAKWVARIRATMAGGGPILLKTNMEAGHGGASGRFDRLAEVALEYAFAIAAVDGELTG